MARRIWFNATCWNFPRNHWPVRKLNIIKKKVDDVSGSDELFTEESFYYVAKQVGLTASEMDEMNISQVLDYIQEFIDNNSEDGKQKTIKASQNDFDAF